MDKQTLSNYGWLVIVTLILAVMLALATPFGTYVGDAVVSVANGFVGASDNAIDEDNIGKVEDQWDSKFDYSGFNKQSVQGATFTDGTFLTWDELKLAKNGEKYGYKADRITNTSIGNTAFRSSSITEIVIPHGVTVIEESAFEDCGSLTKISIPNSVTNIGRWTFIVCGSLDNITFNGTTEEWNSIILGDGWNDRVLTTKVHCTNGDITLN